MSLRDNAFNAGKSWVSNAHASGVANARVVTYGFSKWFNSLSPSAHKSEGVTKATLLKDFKEGYSTAKRKKNPTITTSTLPIGEWSPAHAIRRNADGSVDILREKNSGRRANISEGFMAGGVFHPIRSAADYDASRAGESRAYKKKRKKGTKPTATGRKYTPKKASTKRAMAISRRDYGGDGSRYRNPGTLPTSKKNDVEYVCPDGSKTYSAAKAKRVAKKMAMDLGRNVQIHWRKYSTDKYGSYTVKP